MTCFPYQVACLSMATLTPSKAPLVLCVCVCPMECDRNACLQILNDYSRGSFIPFYIQSFCLWQSICFWGRLAHQQFLKHCSIIISWQKLVGIRRKLVKGDKLIKGTLMTRLCGVLYWLLLKVTSASGCVKLELTISAHWVRIFIKEHWAGFLKLVCGALRGHLSCEIWWWHKSSRNMSGWGQCHSTGLTPE